MLIYLLKSPFSVLALRVSESREKSALVILTASSTNQKLPKTNRAFEMNVSSAIFHLCCPRPKGGRAFPVVCAIPGRRSHGREASFHTRLHQN